MKNILKVFLSLTFLVSFAFTENAKVQSRPLCEETKKIMETQIKEEEENIANKHECDKELQTGIFSNQYPPIFFPYTCHSISAVSALGDSIALEDGSIWCVNSYDQAEVLIWKESDPLLIYPNKSWFSSFQYIIVNQVLGTKIEVNMTHGPLIDGEYSLQIVAIDYVKGEVYLNDNSRWSICSSDRNLLNQWLEGDYIIIGSNNSWFCSLKNILINSNMYNHIRAQQF